MIYVEDFTIHEQLETVCIEYTKTNKIKGTEEYITESFNLEKLNLFMLKNYKDIINSYTETDIEDYSNANGDGEVFSCKFINWNAIYNYITIDIIEKFLKSL